MRMSCLEKKVKFFRMIGATKHHFNIPGLEDQEDSVGTYLIIIFTNTELPNNFYSKFRSDLSFIE